MKLSASHAVTKSTSDSKFAKKDTLPLDVPTFKN